MLIKEGESCPAFDCVKAGSGVYSQCLYCRGFGGVFKEGISCKYSEVPIEPPKFSVGDKVYYLWGKIIQEGIVRNVEYDGRFEYQYTMKGKRNCNSEKTVFGSRKEGDEYLLREEGERLYKMMARFKNMYGELPDLSKFKLIEK